MILASIWPHLRIWQNYHKTHLAYCNITSYPLNPGAHSHHTLLGFDYWRQWDSYLPLLLSPARSAMIAARLGKTWERYSIVPSTSLEIFRPEVSPSSPRSLFIKLFCAITDVMFLSFSVILGMHCSLISLNAVQRSIRCSASSGSSDPQQTHLCVYVPGMIRSLTKCLV